MIHCLQMPPPRVTVIMPSYNAERYISESINSVIEQTFDDWELLIIDDASTDGTTDLAIHYQRSDERIRLIVQKTHRGPAYARNFGLSEARGDFIAFIDSDDLWHPEKTTKQLATMEYHHADISYTAYIRRRDGDPNGKIVTVPETVSYHTMLRRNLIACSTGMVRKSTCGMIRMPQIERRQDHGYWLALLRDRTRITVGVTEPLVWYRIRRDSLSANKFVAAKYSWKLLREVERFHLLKSFWLFTGYAFEALKLRLRRQAGPS